MPDTLVSPTGIDGEGLGGDAKGTHTYSLAFPTLQEMSMTFRPFRRALPVPTLLAVAGALVAADAPAPQPASGVIVVKATKQTEELHRLPATVGVFDDAALKERGATTLGELWQLTPNVSQFTDKPNGQLYIRGVGAGEQPRFGGEENPTRGRHPAVGLYIDGLPVEAERGLAAFDDLLDVERVEILKGPQGTLYGRNALGGVVNVTSRDPGDRASVEGKTFYGSDNAMRVSAAGGGPLGDVLGARLAAGYSRSDGTLKNVTTGDDKTAEWDRVQARGKLLWQASDVLDLRLTVGGTKYEGSTDYWVPYARREERETTSNNPGTDEILGITAALQADWHVEQDLTLTVIGGVARADQEVTYDGDRSANNLANTAGTNESTTGSLEVRLAQRGMGPLRWLAGVYAESAQLDYDTRTRFSDQLVTIVFPAPATVPYYMAIGQPENYHKASEVAARSAALFGEGTWDIDARWSLTAGVRLGYESSTLDWRQDQVSTVASPAAPDGSFSWSGDRDEVVVLPKGALAFHVDEDRMVYASVARGYRAGGLNANATSVGSAQIEYDPEFSWNYELGFRSLWLERTVGFNLTGFYIDLRDQQVFTEQAPFDVIQTNAEKSHVVGAEAELAWHDRSGLSAWASGGLTKAEFDERVGQEFQFTPGPTAVLTDYEGKRFAHVPMWTWALGAGYRHDSGVFGRLDVHGQSWTYVNDKNTDRADAVALIDARLGYIGSGWGVALVGRNLTDETQVLNSITLPADFAVNFSDSTYVRLAPSRSVGIEASAWW